MPRQGPAIAGLRLIKRKMTVSPFSAIFPPHTRYRCDRKSLLIFDRLAYLYEIVEHKKYCLEKARKITPDKNGWYCGITPLPEHKSIQIGANEKDAQNAWSVFIFASELEAYLSEIIRFSNLSLKLLNEEFFHLLEQEQKINNKDRKQMDTIPKYKKFTKENPEKQKILSINPYNKILDENWNEWIEYVSWIRNYLTHTIPLAGTIFDVIQIINAEESQYSIQIPKKNTCQKFNKQMDHNDFIKAIQDERENGIFYSSTDLINDYHPKFIEMASCIFDIEQITNIPWWAE